MLYGSHRYFTDPTDPWILQLKLELQLVGNRAIGIRIYRAQMPTFVGKKLKKLNLFYATHTKGMKTLKGLGQQVGDIRDGGAVGQSFDRVGKARIGCLVFAY
jgi:hypothetical protein